MAMHRLARLGVENMLSSKEQFVSFRNSILDPVECSKIHQHLTEQLVTYLNEVRRHLPIPLLLEVGSIAHTVQQAYRRALSFPIVEFFYARSYTFMPHMHALSCNVPWHKMYMYMYMYMYMK